MCGLRQGAAHGRAPPDAGFALNAERAPSARVEQELALVELQRAPRSPQPAAPPVPLRFKVVNVMNGHVPAECSDARETVQVLAEMRTVLDARVFVWVAARDRWRLLTLGETKALWAFRGRLQ